VPTAAAEFREYPAIDLDLLDRVFQCQPFKVG
jgi:hypothetical protein